VSEGVWEVAEWAYRQAAKLSKSTLEVGEAQLPGSDRKVIVVKVAKSEDHKDHSYFWDKFRELTNT